MYNPYASAHKPKNLFDESRGSAVKSSIEVVKPLQQIQPQSYGTERQQHARQMRVGAYGPDCHFCGYNTHWQSECPEIQKIERGEQYYNKRLPNGKEIKVQVSHHFLANK